LKIDYCDFNKEQIINGAATYTYHPKAVAKTLRATAMGTSS